MIPGKQYTPEVLLRIGWRRKWYILVPFVVIACATAVVSPLPAQPVSIRDITCSWCHSKFPEDYVQPTVTSRLEDRLSSINQQILSRTRLEQIVREFDLYAEERRDSIMEDVIEQMRTRDINVEINAGAMDRRESTAPTFRISYTGTDARTTMRVTERLASLFIEENLRDREALAEGTNQFLDAQLQDARMRLIDQEKRLEEYRRKHAGELPSQLQTNIQAIQNLQLQIQTLNQSISQDRDRRLMLDRLVVDGETLASMAAPPPASVLAQSDSAAASIPAAQQLDIARLQLRALELRLKPVHPDIVRLKRAVADLEKKAEKEALERPVSPESEPVGPVGLTPLELARRARVADMKAEQEALDRRIVAKEAEEKRLRATLATYQTRISAVPARETDLVELTRDYETLKEVYTNLLANSENAKAASNLERRQIGEQFKVLDPARMPEKPISPNRIRINSMGAVAGLGLGLGLVLLLEYRDRTMRTEEDVVGALALPVLALVPQMIGRAERQHAVRRRRMLGAAVAAFVVVAGTAAVVAWRLRLVERWMAALQRWV